MTRPDKLSHQIKCDQNELVGILHEYENALRFYARHEHWMQLGPLGEKPDVPATSFTAMSGDNGNGYAVAEHVLKKHGAAP